MPSLTVAYMTNRRQPRLKWFLDSLQRERRESGIIVDRLVVVSHYAQTEMLEPLGVMTNLIWTAPKPCVWAGPHRLTKDDWFAAGNARNTALCFAPDGWIVFVDDLSLLMPGWLASVALAMRFDGITLGAYRKVKQLRVEHGQLVSCEEFVGGIDSRQRAAALPAPAAIGCSGQWLYGCSLVAPVEAFLTINGWCEDLCGGLGFEDCLTGVVLENAGFKFRYDTRMMTFESEEDHHVERAFRKSDYGISPNDKSHKALELARTLKRFDNGFDLRAMREAAKLHATRPDWGTDSHGAPFPIPTEPSLEWFTSTPLAEL